MNEEEARKALIRWAKDYYGDDEEEPEIKIITIEYDQYEEEWSAELEVSTSADNPLVTFMIVDGKVRVLLTEY